MFVWGPEAGGSGPYCFVCSQNSSLCISLLFCHPPPPPHLELKGFFFFFLEGGSEVAGEGWGLLVERGDVTDERTCFVERRIDGWAYTPILNTIQRNQPLPSPYPWTAVSDGPDINTKGVELRLWGGIFPPSRTLCMRQSTDSRVCVCTCSESLLESLHVS